MDSTCASENSDIDAGPLVVCTTNGHAGPLTVFTVSGTAPFQIETEQKYPLSAYGHILALIIGTV